MEMSRRKCRRPAGEFSIDFLKSAVELPVNLSLQVEIEISEINHISQRKQDENITREIDIAFPYST